MSETSGTGAGSATGEAMVPRERTVAAAMKRFENCIVAVLVGTDSKGSVVLGIYFV